MQTSPFVNCKVFLLPSGKSGTSYLLVWMLSSHNQHPFNNLPREILRKVATESEVE